MCDWSNRLALWGNRNVNKHFQHGNLDANPVTVIKNHLKQDQHDSNYQPRDHCHIQELDKQNEYIGKNIANHDFSHNKLYEKCSKIKILTIKDG